MKIIELLESKDYESQFLGINLLLNYENYRKIKRLDLKNTGVSIMFDLNIKQLIFFSKRNLNNKFLFQLICSEIVSILKFHSINI